MLDPNDPLAVVKLIQEVLDTFDPASKPEPAGSDNAKTAAAIYQALREAGAAAPVDTA